ncbi:UNVERIFIED_CONTAM: hypothetical protein FKN15_064711 [Acipenser sinensis]
MPLEQRRSVLTVWRMHGAAGRGQQPCKIHLSDMTMTRRGGEEADYEKAKRKAARAEVESDLQSDTDELQWNQWTRK